MSHDPKNIETNLPPFQRAIFDQSPIGVALLTQNTDDGEAPIGLRYANPAFYDLLGKAHGPRRHYLRDYLPPTALSQISAKLSGGVTLLEDIFIQSGGKESGSWIKLIVKRLPVEDQVYPVLWLTDISESKAEQRKLEREVAAADAVAAMKSNFLATMSHEIRTPMQTIYGMLELMGEESISPRIKEMLATTKSSANGLLEILDDILDLAKVEAGKMELDDFEIPLRTLIYGLLEALEVKKIENDLYLKAEIEQDIPFVIRGDPKRLRQILMNLIGNGLKFTQSGGITVKITQNVQHITINKGDLGLRVEVIDTGIGMSDEVASRLFKAFAQADNSTTREFGGTGLGLSIAHKLVELMGGQIGVNSRVGEGSTFWFEIPTREVTGDNEVELPDLDGLAVLSVEDHPKGAKEIESSLRSMGAEVVSVDTYAKGLDLIKSRPFDVAIIDHGLPDGWGTDLMKEVNELRPFCGLVLYTVHDDYGVQQSCKFLGAKHLQKPASRFGVGMAVKDAAKKSEQTEIEGPKRVLICEDTASVRDILQRQLEIIGVDVDFAENGKFGLEEIKKGKHGLVITDLHMPEVDGYGVVKTIREAEETSDDDKRFPVIAMTADVQLVHSQTYLKYGFDECLLKPVSMGQLKRLFIRWGVLRQGVKAESKTDTAEDNTEEIKTADGKPPPIDKDAVIQQMGAYNADSLEMIGMFVTMTEAEIEGLKAAAAEGDFDILREVGHSLKGGARSACCLILGDLADKIQSNAEAGQCDDDVITQTVAEFERIKAFLAEN